MDHSANHIFFTSKYLGFPAGFPLNHFRDTMNYYPIIWRFCDGNKYYDYDYDCYGVNFQNKAPCLSSKIDNDMTIQNHYKYGFKYHYIYNNISIYI